MIDLFTPEVTVFSNSRTALVVDNSVAYKEQETDLTRIDNIKVMPWGKNNLLPQEIVEKVEKSEIMGANIAFTRNVAYGLGPKLVKVKRNPETNKIDDYYEIDSGNEYEFFERNDLSMYVLNTISDMLYFHNAFSEIIISKDWNSVYSIRNKEAVFSRWGVNEKKEIINHLYCPDWKNASKSNIVSTPVIDEFDSFAELQRRMTARKNGRLMYSIYMPSPGRIYYSRPEWYSLFDSGWYTQSIAIPEIKRAILENKLGVKHIIYISPKYFEKIFKEKKIAMTDLDSQKKVRDEEVGRMKEFLSGAENAEKAMVAFKEFLPSGNSMQEHKYIEIETVENKTGEGEFIPDIETAANIICYAMGVHSSLIGASPGKTSGSMSGTDKRELYMIKQSLMRGMIDRSMRALSLIKRINKWPQDYMIILPEYIFTTLDQNKSGKQLSNKIAT